MELAISITLHVFFPPDFPGVKRICYARSVIATVPVVPDDVASKTTSWDLRGSVPGDARLANRDFLRGRLPSAMSPTFTAECAATWICSAFQASMGWVPWPGYFDCFAFPLIAALRAAIASSHSECTGGLFRPSNPWSPGRFLIRSRTSHVTLCRIVGERKIDFPPAKRMMTRGDGVRLITAVLFAGQMMTPDKFLFFLVAESCPRQ